MVIPSYLAMKLKILSKQLLASPDRLRIFVLSENKFYPLTNANYQLRQSSNGQIKLVRIQTRQVTRTPAVRRTVPLINRTSLRIPFVGNESPIIPENPIVPL